MTEDLDEHWRNGARTELKRRLDIQLYDFKYSLGHSTYYEAWNSSGLVMGSIHEMQMYGLLSVEETRAYQVQVRTAFAEVHPSDLELFDQIWMWEPTEND